MSIDQAPSQVDTIVVPNDVHEIPFIVGQPTTEANNIIVPKNCEHLRYFDQKDSVVQGITIPPAKKVALWVKLATIIPANNTGFVIVQTRIVINIDPYNEAIGRANTNTRCYVPESIISVIFK